MTAMRTTVVISQPMFFPWVGMFEQIKLADVMVHYDDVQLSKGSLVPRVQIKTAKGPVWLTAPLDHAKSGKLIGETWLHADKKWRTSHLDLLHHHYADAPYFKIMFELAREIYHFKNDNLAEFNRHSLEKIASWLGLSPRFYSSSELNIPGVSSQRVADICEHFTAGTYVTGLGAANYLDYALFEARDIEVRYMAYEKRSYPQLHGEFTPFVSILDAIANCGPATPELLCSNTTNWKDYLNESR